MSTILPANSFRSFPRAPRAQFLANRILTHTHTMTLLDEIIEQREWSGLFQPSIDLKGSDYLSFEGLIRDLD